MEQRLIACDAFSEPKDGSLRFYHILKFSKHMKIALTIGISLIWFVNGLFCKVLNLVPRHQLIVSEILGSEHASIFTKAIGISEILMVVWILSGIKSRYCSIFQMFIVATMNTIEFVVVPDLLLFGRINIVFAFFFILIIYLNEFALKNPKQEYAPNQ